jgi:serine/threonine protein kinase
LAQVLQENVALPVAEAIELFLGICSGLAYAHEHGVIHRDLKPSNIMLVQSGTRTIAKLLDFGISKTTGTQTQSLTQTGAILGSVNYMSPEQCKNGEIDARSDIYSIGIMMYETLVGQAPMQAENDLMIMSNQVNKVIDKVPAKHAISAKLEKNILRCLQKNKDERFSSVQELMQALNECRGEDFLKPRNRTQTWLLPALGIFITLVLIASLVTLKSETKKVIDSEVPTVEHAGPPPSPPPGVDEDGNVPATEAWIQRAVRSHDVDPLILANKYVQSVPSHRGLSLPPNLPEVTQIVEKAYKKELNFEKPQHFKLFKPLIELWVLRSDTEGLTEKGLRDLEKASIKNPDLMFEYRNSQRLLITFLADTKNWGLSEKYAASYRDFAREHGSELEQGELQL